MKKLINIIIGIFFLLGSSVYSQTIGYNTIGADTNSTGGSITICKFTAPASGPITALLVYTFNSSGAGGNMRAAIYSDVAGVPTTKLAESSGATAVPGSAAWISIPISYTFTNGTVYWLGFWDDGFGNGIYYHDAGSSGQTRIDAGATYPTWPSPWTSGTNFDLKDSIYGTIASSSHKSGLLHRK